MKVSLFGATGGTGVEILRRLLSNQAPKVSEVRCVVRSPEKVPEEGVHITSDERG